MPSLDWQVFNSLPGSKNQNFENLCRGLVRLHFGQYGQFAALKNQPGVEFHLKLTKNCSVLGGTPRWYGWQCKLHELTSQGDLKAAARKDIEDSLSKSETYLPGLTDWVLWTPYTLSKKDQEWFKSLQTKFELHQWVKEDIDTYLNGPGLILRSTYFGDLVLTPEALKQRHSEAVQPIRERWLESVHQSVDAERTIRRMLGEPGSWTELAAIGKRLRKKVEIILDSLDDSRPELKKTVTAFVAAFSAFADTLIHFHETLEEGDLDVIQQKLGERKSLINAEVSAAPKRLRSCNLPIALDATNALDDMRIAQALLDDAEEFLGVGLVAILADAGGGKTQMAAQLTAPQVDRPAGVLLHGRDLHRGRSLDDLAHHFSINCTPLDSMERLLASLDAAGKRAGCRLPIVIDGLNEAENPKDWKAPLASLNETVKRYPNILIVCTLRTGEHRREHQQWGTQPQTNTRESFAVMALPDGVRKIECEGFGIDVHDAIEKYFNYFKINPGDAEIPVELLQHPLTLRIFCEVTNPKRETEVKVEYFPASLSPLLEKYVANACERITQMTNLSYSYTTNEVESAIYKFGLELWKVKKREVCEANYRTIVSDTARPWDSSIVNLLAQEGIIFRNPGVEPGEFVITPVYDALGGYIVANSLLLKHIRDISFEWFKTQEVIESFSGDNSHQLAFDIFNSLVTLAPRRMNGGQLWKHAPDPFCNVALRFTTGLEAKYLDSDTVNALFKLLAGNPEERKRLFSRLQGLRAASNHPLNSGFLDSVLRTMPVAERDLSWTEWIRGAREKKLNDALEIESRWKEGLTNRTPSDRLRGKWLMWYLTSTNHELRDVVTRALYWFGRGDPETLFEESLNSLEINDPYVPERMIAASYGVAMARHIDLGDDSFAKTTLSEYARRLYDLIFAEKAPFGTTHLLLREYATRTIELATLHNPSLFTPEQIERSQPIFVDGGLRDWGESKTSNEEYCGSDSPFRMDFENYTLGSLVPYRSNYNYKHEGYQKLRSQILWRVEQLGWSSELFKSVETSIGNERHWPRLGSDAKKVDRYGKKYSWIAYFEMSGLLLDKGVLENCEERTSSVDIDPSFPEPVTRDHLIQSDFLGDPQMEMKEWIAHGPSPDVNQYFQIAKIQEEKGPWVALDGFFLQQDEKRGRKLFCYIRSFLVTNQDADSFLDHLSRQDLGGRWLPEKPHVTYTFAGEIPWCKTFPQNGQIEFSFVTKEEVVKVHRTKHELYVNGKKLGRNDIDLIHRILSSRAGGGTEDQKQLKDEEHKQIELREIPIVADEVKREYVKFNAIIPLCDFKWEGYQTVASNAGHATTLSNEIAYDLELIGQPQTFDMYTKDGVKATFNVSDLSDSDNHQSMFYIKENLLKTYLEKNDLTLIWAIWGEREYSSDQINKLFHGPDRPEQSHAVFSFVKRYE